MATSKKPVFVVLRGAVVLSTGKEVPVEVRLMVPRLTRKEDRELESVSITLHDLAPRNHAEPHARWRRNA